MCLVYSFILNFRISTMSEMNVTTASDSMHSANDIKLVFFCNLLIATQCNTLNVFWPYSTTHTFFQLGGSDHHSVYRWLHMWQCVCECGEHILSLIISGDKIWENFNGSEPTIYSWSAYFGCLEFSASDFWGQCVWI